MANLEPEVWYGQLATFYAASGGLLRDDRGRLLLVKPNYREGWSLPGGVVEVDELPHRACEREILEELGLTVEIGRLLVVDWVPPDGERPRPFIYFLFDCGGVNGQPITVQESELDDYGFFEVDEAVRRVPPNVAGRLPAAIQAAAMRTTVYLPRYGT